MTQMTKVVLLVLGISALGSVALNVLCENALTYYGIQHDKTVSWIVTGVIFLGTTWFILRKKIK
jgi:hypothetical protein